LALKSRGNNRASLLALSDFFARAEKPEAITGHFGLAPEDLAFLTALSLMEDGWRRPTAVSAPLDSASFGRLLAGGFLLARPFKRLIRLSDAGRFLLVLCVR
jgi:hypothetical protein